MYVYIKATWEVTDKYEKQESKLQCHFMYESHLSVYQNSSYQIQVSYPHYTVIQKLTKSLTLKKRTGELLQDTNYSWASRS